VTPEPRPALRAGAADACARAARRPLARRVRRPLALLPVGLLTLGLVGTPAAAAPSADDVRDARAAVGRAQQSVAQMEVRLAELAASAEAAEIAVQVAGEGYTQAVADADAARSRAREAAGRADEAAGQAEQARRKLVTFARQLARTGGSADLLEAALSAEGFQDVARRTTALNQATGKADEAVQEYQAALLVAETMERRSADAAQDAVAAADAAQDALAAAERAQSDAEASLAAGQAERDGLISALAAARQTSAEVERARQDALDAERRARADAAAQAQRTQPPATTGGAPAGAGGGGAATGGTPAAGGSGGSSGSAPSGEGSSGGSSGGSAPAPAPSQAPAPPPAPPAPAPAPEPPPAPAPAPSNPYGLGTGTSRGSAAAGAAAVAWAQSKVGLPYIYGGTGPDGYDCSGLTSGAWRAAGVTINRTSRDQYKQVLKIGYDQLRPGDLVFWATNTNDPGTIYHVAMWAGNGQIVEASKPGVPLRVTPMRWSSTMPFAGRP